MKDWIGYMVDGMSSNDEALSKLITDSAMDLLYTAIRLLGEVNDEY